MAANTVATCPYYTEHGKVHIGCKRGYETTTHKTKNANMHFNKKCANKYTSCSSYGKLERSW